MFELCSHISTVDFIAVTGKRSVLKYTDFLHDNFVALAKIAGDGKHVSPRIPDCLGDGSAEELQKFEVPKGVVLEICARRKNAQGFLVRCAWRKSIKSATWGWVVLNRKSSSGHLVPCR